MTSLTEAKRRTRRLLSDRKLVGAVVLGAGITRQAVAKWRKTGLVPERRVSLVHRLSGTAPHLLRPDLFRKPGAG